MDIFNAWVDAQRKGVVAVKPSDVVANADLGTNLLCAASLLLKLTSLPSIRCSCDGPRGSELRQIPASFLTVDGKQKPYPQVLLRRD
jgi:hypothetical protein